MMSRYPASRSAAFLEEIQKYVIVEPYPFVIDLAQSKGMWIATVDGQRLFDWAGYYASKLLGHNHSALNDPICEQRLLLAAKNKLANPDFLTRECLDYYRELYQLAPRCMRNATLEVYVVNSGAEAVENMMKYFINLHKEKCIHQQRMVNARRFIYFDQAFHGRTIFALNVTQIHHDPVITKDFQGFIPGNLQVPFPAVDNDQTPEKNAEISRHSLEVIEGLLERYSEEVVGIVIEPLQGAGGHRIAQKQFFQGLSQLAHRYDVFLGFDEVQTAGGQLGEIFAVDLFDLPYPPDAIATAKKFGNGVVYMNHSMKDHGVLDSTWGGSLVDMVRFVEEMKIVRSENLLAQVPEKTSALVSGLSALQEQFPALLRNVRGIGLYQGFSLATSALRNRLLDLAMEEEDLLLLGAARDSVRLRPVLDVTLNDIHLLCEKLRRCLEQLSEA